MTGFLIDRPDKVREFWEDNIDDSSKGNLKFSTVADESETMSCE